MQMVCKHGKRMSERCGLSVRARVGNYAEGGTMLGLLEYGAWEKRLPGEGEGCWIEASEAKAGHTSANLLYHYPGNESSSRCTRGYNYLTDYSRATGS